MRQLIVDVAGGLDVEDAMPTSAIPAAEVHIEAPISDPGKIIAVGINYRDHAGEAEFDVPSIPLLFAKFPSSIIGPDQSISWDPRYTEAVDFEAELAVVIGSRARHVTTTDALGHVFGYTCLNDVSARDLQFTDGQWVRGKSLDTFCPIGPAIVTSDEIPNPNALRIFCDVNGVRMQDASTSEMVFSVAELVAFCSEAFTLEPGDIIATGTPPGVGYFRTPRVTLATSDEVTVGIEGIGNLRNPCIAGKVAPASY